MPVAKVYCDEAGYTGNKMLDEQQPYFTYSAVVIEPDEAEEIVSSIIRDFNVQGGELKADKLVKYNKGRRAISRILDHLDGRYHTVFHLKKYSLACKFFEYIFEPVLKDNNLLFYKRNFHRHVANLLYMHFESRISTAEDLMSEFERFMRERDRTGLETLFSPATDRPDVQDALTGLLDFAVGYQDIIIDEVGSLDGVDGVGKWVLDLTTSSVSSLLALLGSKHDILEVYCDDSRPLAADAHFFDVMVDRDDRRTLNFFGKERLVTWNMNRPIQLVKSHENPGIQLADIISGSLSYALRKKQEATSQEWLEIIHPNMCEECIIPDMEAVDLESNEAFLNAVALLELGARAQRGADPLEGMAEFYAFAEHQLSVNPPAFRLHPGKK